MTSAHQLAIGLLLIFCGSCSVGSVLVLEHSFGTSKLKYYHHVTGIFGGIVVLMGLTISAMALSVN